MQKHIMPFVTIILELDYSIKNIKPDMQLPIAINWKPAEYRI